MKGLEDTATINSGTSALWILEPNAKIYHVN